MKKIATLALLATLSDLCFSVEPSYRCDKATTSVEKMICAENELATLDYKMAHIYEIIMDDDVVSNRVSLEQQRWLEERNGCATESCVKRAYINRISDLHTIAKDIRQRMVRSWDRGCTESPYLEQSVSVRGDQVQFPVRNVNLFRNEETSSRQHVLYSNCVSEADIGKIKTCTFSLYEKRGSCYRELLQGEKASMDTGEGFKVLDSLPDYLPLPEGMLPKTSRLYKYLSFETIKECRYATGTFRDPGTTKTVKYLAYETQRRTYKEIGYLTYDFCEILQN